MPCDECAIRSAEAAELKLTVRLLEGVIDKRDDKSGEALVMNKMLHQEIARLRQRVIALESELAWRQADK